MDVPKYMQPGSRGVAANLVLAFLAGYFASKGVDHKITCDGIYGDTGADYMKMYQNFSGIEADGCVGPDTRARMIKDGFDLEAALRSIPGKSVLIQADGEAVAWPEFAESADSITL